MARLAGSIGARSNGQALDVHDMEDWAASAEVGGELPYAWGWSPPRERAAWSRARELSDEGEVRLHSRRLPDGQTQWYMVKRAPRLGEQPVAVVEQGPETEEAAVLRILRRAVRLGMPCPTNAEIGRQIDLTATQAAYRVRLLRADRLILLEERGPGERRICTISGKSTPAGKL